MLKTERRVAANSPLAPGLDRDAVDRAQGAIAGLPQVLAPSSVATLAREVISRMAERHRAPQVTNEALHVERLVEALLAPDETAALRLVLRLLSSGTPVEDLYLGHLAEAARRLGDRWDQDRLSSPQMTIAAARIYTIMRGISSRILPKRWPDGRHAVFATVPGERHTLGVTMAADIFRHEGWLIDVKVGRSHDELVAELAQTEFRILALSATSPVIMGDLARLIAAVRIAAPYALILICGRLVRIEPGLCRRTDADAATDHLGEARSRMEAHLAVMTHFSRAGMDETEFQ